MKELLRMCFLLTLAFSTSAQTFTKVTTSPLSSGTQDTRNALLTDLDNNSQPDIHFANVSYQQHKFFLNFDTTFIAPNGGLNSVVRITANVTSGDINQDGWPDLFYANGSGGNGAASITNYLYRNDSAGVFTLQSSGATSLPRTSVAAVMIDFDEDGDLDIYVSNSGSTKSELYRNDGSNNFTSIDTLSITNQFIDSRSPAWCDYDNDGDLDLFLAVVNGNNRLYRNDDSTFTQVTSGSIVQDGGQSFSASWGDYNADGFIDLFVTNSINSSLNFLYKNLGNGTFQKITSAPFSNDYTKSTGSVWIDFDNDGDLDLFAVGSNGSNNSLRLNRLYQNNGNGTFSKISTGSLVTDQSNNVGVASGDIDKDGDIDLLLAHRNGNNELYLNDYNGNNGFVSFNILGTHGKSTALNAKVKMKCAFDGTNSRWEYRRVTSATGYSGESSPITHFGTGSATIVDSLVIEWINGASCTFTNIDINHFYNISPSGCSMDLALQTKFSDSTRYYNAQFNDSTIGDVVKYIWDFGDGNSSTQANPLHIYNNPGSYIVNLYTFDSYQKWDSAQSTITICPDTAKLGFISFAQGQTISFSDTSISNGYIFQWDFGDGNSATGKNVNNYYSQTGSYNVCLFVTDSCRTDTICQNIQVCADTIIADFGINTSGFNLSLTDSSKNSSFVSWDFGDGTSDTAANPTHAYSSPGYYLVCMTVGDSCALDSTCKKIGICIDTAIANFNFIDTSTTIHFTSTSQNANSLFWDFGDGNFSSNTNPSHTYQQTGSYTVCLIVDNDCYSDTLCKNIFVCPKTANASFTNKHVAGLTIQFNNQSTNAIAHQWDFGDGNSSTKINPIHTFSSAWYFNSCLVVTDSCGKTDSTCKILNLTQFSIAELEDLESVTVFPNPVSDNLIIEVPETAINKAVFTLYDSKGSELISQIATTKTVTWNAHKWASGIYILSIEINGIYRTIKVIKQ